MNLNELIGAFIAIIIIISLSMLFLKTFWWLCFAGSVFIVIYLIVKKRREAKSKKIEPLAPKITYTQKCPACGANIEVDEDDEYARCEYCGTSSLARYTKEKKPPKVHDSSKEIEMYLKILAGILFVLGVIGLYLQLTYVPTNNQNFQSNYSGWIQRYISVKG